MLQKHKPGSIREMTAIALPMVISHSCETIMTFTDRMFLSKIGTSEMNAAMSGGITAFMTMTFFMGLIGYSNALVAQYFGADRKNNCAIVISQGLLISIIAYPLILFFKPNIIHLFEITGIEPAQLEMQKTYFSILMYGTIFGLLRTTFSSFFSGTGRTRIVMTASFTAMIVNIFFNYILIYGKLGFPMLGVSGAAIGTIIGAFCGFLVLAFSYFKKSNLKAYNILRSFKFNASIMKLLLRFGYPTGLEMFLNLLAFTIIIMIFQGHSPATAAAATIVFNWDMVSFLPLLGLEIGLISLVGRYMGAKKQDYAHTSVMSAVKVGIIYSTIIFILFVLFPEYLVNIFKPVSFSQVFADAFPTAVFMIRLASLYVLVEVGIIIFSGALRGAGDTFWVMSVSVSLHWILVPVLLISLKILDLSTETAWALLVAIFLAFSSLFYLRYRTGKWRSIDVIGYAEEVPLLLPDDYHEQSDL
ncbi:MAG: MATE family efflux transporter [Elusimicrobiota bacterium]